MFELFNVSGVKLAYGSYSVLKVFAKTESLKNYFITPAI